MSFFLLEEEQAATLEEALAFIEACSDVTEGTASDHSTNSHSLSPSEDSDEHSASGSTSDGSYYGCDGSTSQSRPSEQTQIVPALANRRRAANTKAVDRYRKRAKAEILDLREQVVQLDARVAQLRKRDARAMRAAAAHSKTQRATHHDTTEPPCPRDTTLSVGIEHAVAEYRKLQASQLLNRRLKDALGRQTKMNQALETLLQKQIAKNDLDFVLAVEKKQVFPRRESMLVFRELLQYMEEVMYSRTAVVLASINLSDTTCAFSNSFMKQDPMLGQVFEFTANTPLPCSQHQLEKHLWAHLSGLDAHQPPAPVDNDADTRCERHLTMEFDCQVGDIHVDGVSAIRRFVSQSQTVITYTSLLAPLGSGLLFREAGWLVISDSSGSPSSSPTLFQTSYRLHLEKSESGAALSPKTAYLHKCMMNAQSEKMRAYQLKIQDMLLHEFDWIVAGGSLGLCPQQIECGA